jgi:hypothetical protein
MFELVFMLRRCRKRAAEWMSRAESAVTAEERYRHLMVAEHYSALADNAERSMKAAWLERFPGMQSAQANASHAIRHVSGKHLAANPSQQPNNCGKHQRNKRDYRMARTGAVCVAP